MKKIMMIGYGAMAKEVLARLPQGVVPGWIGRVTHIMQRLPKPMAIGCRR